VAYHPTDFLDYFATNPHLKKVTYKKGEIIFFPGNDDKICYIVMSGYARAYTIDKHGEMSIQIFYSTGDTFPVHWIINKPTTSTFIDAMTDCVIAKIPQVEVKRIIHEDAAAANILLQRITDQFAAYASRIGNLGFKYTYERLAYRLLLLASRFGHEDEATGEISLPNFSQKDIAATINASRESVNRELHNFEHAGFIKNANGKITILDTHGLRDAIGDDNEHFYFDA
jgi:CRP-like cAMP-binding protein